VIDPDADSYDSCLSASRNGNASRNFGNTRVSGTNAPRTSPELSSQIGFPTVSLPSRPSNNGSRAARTECTVISNNDRLNCDTHRGGVT